MHWLIDLLDAFGEKVAVVHRERPYTYRDLRRRVLEHLSAIEAVPPGNVVAMCSDYSFDAVAMFLALLQRKAVIVPIATKVEEEVRERLEEAYVDTVVFLEGGSARLESCGRRGEGHEMIGKLQAAGASGLILFSSGSTGRPKAMIHDLDRLVDSYRGKRPKELVLLVFLMFDHIGGLNTLLSSLAMGTTIVIPGTRDPDEVCSLVERHRVHVLPASPTFLNLVLIGEAYRRHDLSSLKMVTYGTEPMPESLLVRLKEAFPRVRFLQTFGTSETGIAQTSSKSSTSTLLKIEGDNVEYRIVDGELLLRSRTQILGYLNAPMDGFTEDGWFRTGDLVEVAGDGYLKIVGRNKEMINVGGEKVLPSEIESVLLQMPEIADCLVYGEKNPIMGQVVAGDVVLREGVDPKDIRRRMRLHCKDRLASFKIPVKVNVVDRTNFNDRFKKIRSR